jgi:oxygen-independent coproporphyrinogen-3 oxidase
VADASVGFEARERLSPVEAAEERLLGGLRIQAGVPFAEAAALGLTAGHPKVRELVALGLVADDAERLRATAAGRRVLDRLTAELAAG